MVNISSPFNGNEKFFPKRLKGNVLTGNSSTQFAVSPQQKQTPLQLPAQPQGQQQLLNNNSIIGNSSPIPTNIQPVQQQGNSLDELILQGAQQKTPGIFENPQFLQTLGFIAQAFDPDGSAGRLASQVLDQQSNDAFSKALANTGILGGANLPAGITPESSQVIADIKQREEQNNLFIKKLLQDSQLAKEANKNRIDVANIQAREGPLVDLQKQLLQGNIANSQFDQRQEEQKVLTTLSFSIGTPDKTGTNITMTPEQKQIFYKKAQLLGISTQRIQDYLNSIQETPEPGQGFLNNLFGGVFGSNNQEDKLSPILPPKLPEQPKKQNIPSTVPGGGFTPPSNKFMLEKLHNIIDNIKF